MRKFILAMAALCAAALSCGPVSAQNQSAVVRLDKAANDKAAMDAALERYLDDSEAALAARMAELRTFFNERKTATPGFAQAVLGTWGKFQMTGSMLGDVINQFATGFGARRVKPSFDAYVEDCFREKVLDPAKARKAVDNAVTGFLGDLAEIEARLLVTLKVDISDAELNLPKLLPGGLGIGGTQYEAVLRDTVDLAVKDLGVSLGTYIVSNIISDKIVDATVPEGTSKKGKLVANVATGIAVDKAMEEAMKTAGYNPEKVLAIKVAAGIDQMSSLLIDGDPALDRFYPKLFYGRLMHPDQAVRDACNRADATLMKNANFGLRYRMVRLYNDRHRQLWKVLTTHFLGAEAAKSPFMMYTPLDASKCSPAEQIIRWADSIANAYGRKKQ